jgi:Mannosyltransferase (PIG-V)
MRTRHPERSGVDAHSDRAASDGARGAIIGGSGLRYCFTVFIVVRVVLAVLALIAVGVLPHVPVGGATTPGGAIPGPVGVPGWPAHAIGPGWENVFTVWERFDALWFLRIAQDGYAVGDGSAAFFPLFPMLVRVVSVPIGGHPLAAGLIVSNLASLGSLILLYGLTREELSERAARSSVLFASLFPTAFFFVSPYSESLFLLLAVGCLWAARRGRWWVAGMAGALAALTRNIGVLLVLPLAVEAAHHLWVRRPRRFDPRALWALAPVVGLGLYLWFWQRLSGDWLAPLHQQAGWQRDPSAPWATLGAATKDAWEFLGIYPGGYHLLDLVVAVPVLLGAIAVAAWFRPTFAVYTWAGILAPLAFIFADRPLMSFPRFALPLFPVYWAFARWTDRSRLRREVLIGASAGLMGLLFVLFANWYYVF